MTAARLSRPARRAAATAVALAAVGMSATACSARLRVTPPAATRAARTTVSSPTRAVDPLPRLPHGPTGPAHHPSPAPARAAPPVRLTIPAIGVDTALQPLHLLPDRTLQTPTRWNEAGWYAGGVRPGDAGPAVIAGHVDSVVGPAVFFRLRELRPNDRVMVRDRTGAVLSFVVDTVRTYPKDRFPTAAVYGPTPVPELRLVTCTGEFDYATRSYLDNLVVNAHLAG